MVSRALSTVVLAWLLVSGLIVEAYQTLQPTYRSAVRTVPIYATVTDARGRLVPDLSEQDFAIAVNGKPAPVALFSRDPQPFTAVVMLDTSASVVVHLDRVLAAAAEFFARLLPADRAQVGAFNDRIQLNGTFTNDRTRLTASLSELELGNPTRLHDGIMAGIHALQGVQGRRVVLVFTDGEDTASRATFDDVLERARVEGVMVYAVGLESDYFDGTRARRTRPSRDLRRLAEDTGGGYFELMKTTDLSPTFARVAEELRSQYLLGFAPPSLDGRTHTLDVRVLRRGMHVRARKSYLAAPDTPGGF
jgi:Ca-activated chloride channel family protein